MKSSDYWRGRALLLEQATHAKSEEYIKSLNREYAAATKRIEAEIAVWYQRLAVNNEITLTEAKQWLKAGELKELKWTVEEYIKAGQENNLDGRWIKQLENASARVHISRLDSLKLQMQQNVEMVMAKHHDGVTQLGRDIFDNSYLHTAFDTQKGFGYGREIQQINFDKVDRILSKPWAADGRNFSDRIWTERDKLVNTLQTELTQGLIRGDGPKEIASRIAERMGVSQSQAERLVRTESAFFAASADLASYKEMGVKEYEIVATLDNRTSAICQSWDGEHLPLSQFEPGVTAPPFHVYCRSTTAPYFEDLGGERAARAEDKSYYTVPANMKYPEWKEKFVKGAPKAIADPKIIKLLNAPGILIASKTDAIKGFEEFKAHAENMQEPYKNIYTYYANNTELVNDPLQMGGFGYDPDRDAMIFNEKFLKLPKYQQTANMVYSHELAHRYDVLVVKSWENTGFTDAISAASKRISGKLVEYNKLYASLGDVNPAFQDILSALSNNKIEVQIGHPNWTERLKSLEIFANLSYLNANMIEIPEFDGLLTEIIREFDKMFGGLV
ncbi:MAG: minor capsid protein [Clostridiales bacterium]|nr:minor capsid protein [Clostridiales bacterium]